LASLAWRALAMNGAAALPASDPMLSAAQPSALAARSVLVAVTRAGERLVAVGERGHVLLSDDQGGHWRQAQVPASVTLTAVRFVGAQLGWAVGHSGVILHSSDGGEHWARQFDGRLALQALQQLADSSGDLALQQRIERQVQDGPDKPFLAVHFSDAHHGLAVGAYGWAFGTDDGGAHWTPLMGAIANLEERHLYALHERADGLYLAGEQGQIWRRAPGGARFMPLETHSQSTVFDLLSSPDGALLAIGLGGKVLRSTDQGRNWQSSLPAGKAALTAGLALPSLPSVPNAVVLASETGQLLFSRDGGLSFQVADLPPYPTAGLAAANANGQLLAVGPLGALALTLPASATH
jgi:photosystem II stability/assembly factor-like uncharacterized protein